MSDKSFGDHMSRGVVKNPLLSTAVTGMSIEDLTQNAVLLPVSRTQELFGRQEHTQTVTPARGTPKPSGDATPIHPQNEDRKENKDDFDVNEYFARLQGTTYVSAPINTHLDNANNLRDKEVNLEEINLNEPGVAEDPQQSLTADIAQNFSQLPTVLPQVASAVFSSFSNMLSMKSREHTPEDVKHAAYAQDVPLVGVGEAREVAPPPKEPPVCGHTNFRLTTKKKYAQIPGLSSGESVPMPTYTPPAFNQPIFTPPHQEIKDNFANNESNTPKSDVGHSTVDFNVFSNTVTSIPVESTNVEHPKEAVVAAQFVQDFNPQGAIIPPPPMFSNLTKKDGSPNVGRTILPPSVARKIGSNKPMISNQAPAFATFDNIFVPAPVAADTDSAVQSSAPQSLAPTLSQINPSVAPNVSYSSQPSMPTPMPPANLIPSQNVAANVHLATPAAQIKQIPTSQIPPIPTSISSASEISHFTGNVPPPTNFSTPPETSHSAVPSVSHAGSASITLPLQSYVTGTQSETVAPPPVFTPGRQESVSNIPPPAILPPTSTSAVPTSFMPVAPQIFNPYSQDQLKASQSTIGTDMSGPENRHVSLLKSGTDSQLAEMSTSQIAGPSNVPEPPKALSNTIFRMTKKRPQYYSGPIDGVGAISNNVKPTLTPVATTAFQGAVFTPETNPNPDYQGAVFTSENNKGTPSHGAILNPGATENQNQSSMFTPLGINVDTSNTQYGFDTNKSAENVGYTTSDKAEVSQQYNYNTTFDMSRQARDTYEPPKQESSFGIIGSLKSKLSSIDINKLQNSVTTFFDPGYNAVKTDTTKASEPTYGQNQGIEIFVANPETHPQPYSYDAHQASFTYGQGVIPNASDYYNQQIHNMYSTHSYYSQPSYGTESYSRTEIQGQQAYSQLPNATHDPTTTITTASSQETNVPSYQPNIMGFVQDNVVENTDGNQFAVSQEATEFVNIVSTNPGHEDNITTGFQGQPGSNMPETTKQQSEKHIEEAMKNLQIENERSANVEQISAIEEQDALNKNMLQTVDLGNPVEDMISPSIDDKCTLSVEKAFLDIVNRKSNSNYFDLSENSDKQVEEFSQKENANLGNIFSAPLHDLSSIIAATSQEISDGVSEPDDEVSWNTNEEEVDCQSVSDRVTALADSEDESSQHTTSGQTVDLNICETCREVKQPEPAEKAADFTSQLIENITAPIQLSNPVEVPLTEINTAVPDDFDTISQGAEIALIADETIETLQLQSATELLDEDENKNIEKNYDWRTEAPLPPGEDLLDHDYTFKTTPNAMGFFPNNNLFFDTIPNNASDEIKAEYKVSQEEPPIVLHRQMSIPTAPPAEDFDDAKSDETGLLDVLSIEQDASKDFPVFEEYVIEPSETDDDKLEIKDKNDELKDTFTKRVDRFKKLEGSDDSTEQKDFNLGSSNPMMPSYFDTGNYAVDTHLKKSLTTPTISRIPPGFEDHYERRKDKDNEYEIVKIPDTSTQMSVTTTISDATTKIETLTSTVFSNMAAVIQEPQPEAKLPDFSSVFGAKIEFKDTVVSSPEEAVEIPAEDQPVSLQVKLVDKVQKEIPTLPDPINFFGSTVQGPEAAEGVNRLASYFASPAKTDNTKSFFELSQSQNHYRQETDDKIEGHKPFFELSQSQDHYKENQPNISNEKYIANLNLMKDLTSCQNIEPTNEQIVKTVNYFTVEYDLDMCLNKGEPNIEIDKKYSDVRQSVIDKEETVLNDEKLTDIVNECTYCRDCKGPVLTVRETDFDSIGEVHFRQAMDTGSNPREEVNMQPAKDEGRSVNVTVEDVGPDGNGSEGLGLMTENRSSNDYEPAKHHWFYRVDCEEKSIWRGFSTVDSRAIENAFQSPDLSENTLVPTDGGRYDVNVVGRLRVAVYWSDKPTNVRRCSWFYKGTTDARYVPYTEGVAEKLEVEYRHGITTGEWHRRLVLPNNELVVMHGPAVMVHFLQGGSVDPFGAPNQSTMRPRVVRRGTDESEIEDTEPSSIDHLLLLCHGVGSACDMRFRAVEEVVDDFRSTSLQLLQSHYRNSYDNGVVGRVEVLPISWHASLHSGPAGVDRRLARVTLASIPRLRSFTNDTVLDVLFYTSPHYCQMILDTVCSELNRIYSLFKARNPDFKGQVSLGGHSLGSVILYDLLCNQPVPHPLQPRSEKTYLAGTLAHNPAMRYPKLGFEPVALYALGSPIAIFECIRGVESLGSDFQLPTCRNFFNIFHPYDPIAYRMEPLVNPQLQNVKPSLIPHHKGRKRMHLELKETMARVGADLKQKLLESIKSTWSSMWSSAPPDHHLEKVVEEEIEKEQLEEENSKEEPVQADLTPGEMLGRLNGGRRIDYVLQEAPFEMINEYLFAMTSHVCYWESEDVMLLILREIYDSMGVQPDVVVPQQSLSVQRVTLVRDGERIVTNTDASTSRVS